MTASISFPGSGFFLESVLQINAATLRVTFTDDPLLVSSTGAHDALNPGNYVLSGPGANGVQYVSAVNGSNQQVDIYLAQQLLVGAWILTVSNIRTISAVNLQAPTSIGFQVSSIQPPAPLGQGAQSPSSYDVVRKFFNPALKGKNWTALVHGIATGDDIVKNDAILAFNQLFRSTASAPYLDDLVADYGDQRPAALGLNDDLLRRLSIEGSAYKTLESTLEAVLEVFYGSTATRASATSTLTAPWDLRDGDQLSFVVDRRQTVTITFSAQDFSQIGQASGIEAAMAVTRGFLAANSRAYALPIVNPLDGQTYLQVFSPSLGLDGSIQVIGGRAQNVFEFPTLIDTTQAAGTQWTLVTPTAFNGLAPGTVRFTWSAGPDPSLTRVQIGDVALVYGSGFSAQNRGSLPIIKVTPTYFEAQLVAGLGEVVTTALASDLTFLSPDIENINGTQRPAFAATTDTLEIVLPTTTEIVVREPNTAAYLHGNPELGILSGSRDSNGILTVTTDGDHGLIPGGWVWLQGLGVDDSTAAPPHWTGAPEPVSVDNPAVCRLADGRVLLAGGTTGGSGLTSAYVFDPGTGTWTSVGPMNVGRSLATATLLPDGKVLVVGGTIVSAVCELFDPDTNTWTVTGGLNEDRDAHSSVYIPALNKVLVLGGSTIVDASVEFYDVVSGAWTLVTGVLSSNRSFGNAVTLRDGRILSLGGSTSVAAMDLYTPANNSWTTGIASLITARSHGNAITVSAGTSGNVYVMGGSNGASALATVEIINPATMTVSAGPVMPVATRTAAADTLLDGRLAVVGGLDTGGTAQRNIQILDVVNGIWTQGPLAASAHVFGAGVTLNDGRLLVSGPSGTAAEDFSPYLGTAASGAVNGLFKILTVPDSSSFTVQQSLHAVTTLLATGSASSARPDDNGISGPFIYDVRSGIAITGTLTQTTAEVIQGQSYRVLQVVSTTGFPATGWLCFNFGYRDQVTPVKYLAVLSSTQILLDPSYRFPITMEPGTTVNYVSQNYAWVPEDPESEGSFYLTTTAAGRIAAEAKVKDLIAAGIPYDIRIEYPGDRGLGNEGFPVEGEDKLSDIVRVYGGDDLDVEIPELESE